MTTALAPQFHGIFGAELAGTVGAQVKLKKQLSPSQDGRSAKAMLDFGIPYSLPVTCADDTEGIRAMPSCLIGS
jgi:hypothetical protein